MHPKAKSEASASTVRGRSGWKCCRIGEKVNACCRPVKATAAAADQANLTALRVREVRGAVREEQL